MIATSSEDRTAQFRDVQTSTHRRPSVRHTSAVADPDFRPDGRALVTVADDGGPIGTLPEVPPDDFR